MFSTPSENFAYLVEQATPTCIHPSNAVFQVFILSSSSLLFAEMIVFVASLVFVLPMAELSNVVCKFVTNIHKDKNFLILQKQGYLTFAKAIAI